LDAEIVKKEQPDTTCASDDETGNSQRAQTGKGVVRLAYDRNSQAIQSGEDAR